MSTDTSEKAVSATRTGKFSRTDFILKALSRIDPPALRIVIILFCLIFWGGVVLAVVRG